jgi:signal transduction histidine kinase
VEISLKKAALESSLDQAKLLAARLITAQEEERTRISRELHDDIGQKLASLAIGLSRLKRYFKSPQKDAKAEFADLQQRTFGLTEDLRRLSHELHPSTVEHIGFVDVLKSRCEDTSIESGVLVSLVVGDDWPDVSSEIGLCLYRVAQESLRNVVKHASAKSSKVSLTHANGHIVMKIADDGKGFSPSSMRESVGLGLVSMRERLQILGGSLIVESSPAGGSIVTATIPFGEDA